MDNEYLSLTEIGQIYGVKLMVVPLGTRRGTVCSRLTTPDGERVELRDKWIARSGDRKVWARYFTSSGQTWWLDDDAVDAAGESSKGKRKPFAVEIDTTEPPPEDAICAMQFEYH